MRPERGLRLPLERVALIGAIAFVGYLLSRYDMCFQDAEGLIRGFMFDEGVRSRFIGYLAYILTVETRLALWDLVPPHPSFTPIWIVTLLAGPVLLFKFLHIELRSRPAAMAGAAVYLVSTGYLSGATMLFHQAKPLANVVIIATLYLSARINDAMRSRPEDGGEAPAPLRRLWVGLLAVLTVGPFVDETAAFAYLIAPVWCPDVFWPRGARRTRSPYVRNRIMYAVPLCLVAVVMLAILPAVYAMMGGHFNLLEYLERMARGGAYLRFDPVHVVWHAGNLLIPGLVPLGFARFTTPVTDGPELHVVVLVALAATVLLATEVVRRRRVYWDQYRKLGTLMALFVGFQSLVLVFHPQELSATGFYYGAIFSVFFASLVAAVFVDAGERQGMLGGVTAARLGLLWVLIVSAVNFMAINATWIAHSNSKALELLQGLPTYGQGNWAALDARQAAFAPVNEGSHAPASERHYVADTAVQGSAESFAAAFGMWTGWRRGGTASLADRPLTFGDLWLVVELRMKDRPRGWWTRAHRNEGLP